MKKLTAILFLLLLLFNLAGYRLWFYYAQQKADAQMAAVLDKEQYNENDLLELRVPLTLPYQTNWDGFERVDGSIELNGKTYKYFKRKVVNGEMVLLCLPDQNRSRIESARDNFFKLANSFQSDDGSAKKQSPGTPVKLLKLSLSDFCALPLHWQLPASPQQNAFAFSSFQSMLAQLYLATPTQPPDVTA